MKRIISFCIMTLLLVSTVGCTKENASVTKSKVESEKENNEKKQISYFGEGDEWFGTYTISKVKSSYFDSLYIQYIMDRNSTADEQTTKKIGILNMY